jgi:PAS domain S-box-containing protein
MVDEIHRLRTALRDLVAVSTLPAAWIGRDPTAIADGLADALARALELDFTFVRLNVGDRSDPVDVTRGTAWSAFPAWLRDREAAGRGRSYLEVMANVGENGRRYRGLVVPIGFGGVSGLVAAAAGRPDFPTETEQLLLWVAANHAAMAFQSAALVRELRHAEEGVRQARDDLEMKIAERTRELRRAGLELETILDASPLGMVLVNGDQTVQRCNAAFERLVGWSADEIVGHRFPLMKAVEERCTQLASDLGNGHGFSGIELRITRKDGSEFDAIVACTPLSDDHSRPAGLVANIEDVSDRKRSEEALRKAHAELAHVTRLTTLGEMAASIAHEINQPLTAILANAAASLNWLARPGADLDSVREALADIVNDGHRAADVIQRIRQVATKSDPHRSPLSMNEVIDDVVALVRTEVQKHRVALRVELSPTLPPTLGDRVQLQQVVMNLVMNGVEAMARVHDRPRELVIRSDAWDNRVFVAVRDTGVGIDPRDADQLFDAFFTTKTAGMGMGLSISRSIVEGHGGRLWATPNDAHGATFQFALPANR